jgi:hypothetical protein
VSALSLCVVVLALASLAGGVDSARACSCAQPDPWTHLREFDGAFVGRLVARREVGGGMAVLTFDVERALKGAIGGTVDVRTRSSGASCGIEASVGQRVGLFLRREGRAWVGDLCRQVAPADLLTAAAPLPAPDGRGAVAMYVGGRFGPARTMALDARGRTLRYGSGSGFTRLLSLCPGGERLSEIAERYPGSELAIRDTRTLRVVRRRALELPRGRYPDGLQCENASGSSVVVFGLGAGEAPRGAGLFRISRGRLSVIWTGSAHLSTFTRRYAYLNAGPDGRRFVRLDLRTARTRYLASVPFVPRLVPDPTGRLFAGVAWGYPERSRLVLVRLGKAPAVRSVPLDAPMILGDVHWLPNGRLLFVTSTDRDGARVLDRSLRTHVRFPWRARDSARVGSTVFGVDGFGRLVRASLPEGPQRTGRRMPGGGRGIVLLSVR